MMGHMSLGRRLRQLERDVRRAHSAAGQGNGPSARACLLAHLDTLAERVRAGGDLDDGPHLAPVERLVRAWERGDGATARAVLAQAAGRALS